MAEVDESAPVNGKPVQTPNEITPTWESAELSDARGQVSIPAGIARSNHRYRVRARMEDGTGRWSHWSEPVEFVAR